MASVSVPKDLQKVKTTLFYSLTKRQIISFGGGIVLGLPVYFLVKNILGVTCASMLFITVLVPFFILALYEKNGLPAEEILSIRQRFEKRKGGRPYCVPRKN